MSAYMGRQGAPHTCACATRHAAVPSAFQALVLNSPALIHARPLYPPSSRSANSAQPLCRWVSMYARSTIRLKDKASALIGVSIILVRKKRPTLEISYGDIPKPQACVVVGIQRSVEGVSNERSSTWPHSSVEPCAGEMTFTTQRPLCKPANAVMNKAFTQRIEDAPSNDGLKTAPRPLCPASPASLPRFAGSRRGARGIGFAYPVLGSMRQSLTRTVDMVGRANEHEGECSCIPLIVVAVKVVPVVVVVCA